MKEPLSSETNQYLCLVLCQHKVHNRSFSLLYLEVLSFHRKNFRFNTNPYVNRKTTSLHAHTRSHTNKKFSGIFHKTSHCLLHTTFQFAKN